ncbi:MAG: methyltransferase [Bryobacteraceae bacterium]
MTSRDSGAWPTPAADTASCSAPFCASVPPCAACCSISLRSSKGAAASGHFTGCEGRIEFEPGSFLERVPSGCDAYIMKHIIHDWSDADCCRILGYMRDGLAACDPERGRVFLLEMVVPDQVRPGPEVMLDIEMLVATLGGKERTRSEFEALFASAGLQLVSITPTHTPMCVIEARLS